MQGYFDVKTMDARGLRDEDFEQAIKAGDIRSVLADLKVQRHCAGKNMLNDNFAGYVLDRLFSLPACATYYNEEADGAPSASLAFINLMTTDTEPVYTDAYSYRNTGTNIHNMQDSINTTSSAKRFEEDEIEAWRVWVPSDGREAIKFRNRVLWIPSEGVSSNIRTIGINYNENGDGVGGYNQALGRVGRIRLKDTAGNKVILTKNDREVLLVEYTFTYVTL